MIKITKDMLISKSACPEQVQLFESLFPNGVKLTKALCLKHAQEFEWNWAAQNLLSSQAWAEYAKVEGPAWAKYWKIEGQAWAEDKKLEGPAWAEYEKKQAVAFYKAWTGDYNSQEKKA